LIGEGSPTSWDWVSAIPFALTLPLYDTEYFYKLPAKKWKAAPELVQEYGQCSLNNPAMYCSWIRTFFPPD